MATERKFGIGEKLARFAKDLAKEKSFAIIFCDTKIPEKPYNAKIRKTYDFCNAEERKQGQKSL